ncbi:MAG: Hsp20/alpha crystallin family protein [Acidobacteriota bacterium]|nr:Hsp20/alpha crystallin family protein [Acidobacteriota bacterium]
MPWDPMRDLLIMQERLDSLFGRASPGWMPLVDLYETPESYVISAELPGLAREDFAIELQANTLILKGRRPETAVSPRSYQQLECGQGPFSRTFRFSNDIDADAINAEFKDGVLVVTVPKSAQAASRRIDVT